MAPRVVFVLLVTSALLIFSLISITAVQHLIAEPDKDIPHVRKISEIGHATLGISSNFHAPKQNVWAELDDAEVAQVLHYLHSGQTDLNLTKSQGAGPWDNYVLTVEAIPPPKSKTLSYLQGKAEIPERFARVIVNHGAAHESHICEYSIGPLPIVERTKVEPLTNGHKDGRYCTRNRLADLGALQQFLTTEMYHVSDILADLLGEALGYGQGLYSNLILGGRMLRTGPDGRLNMWSSVSAKADAWSLLPQGLYVQLDVTGRDTSKWSIKRWFYAGQLYNSTEAFRSAWESSSFRKSPPNLNDGWTDIEDFDSQMPGRELPPPVMVQPAGSRVALDPKENFISWMGFEFYITSRTANAMALYDIKFRGESVMYELGLQEALAHYAGDNPMQSGQLWLDSFFGMGLRMFELVPGYDCPAYAHYINTSFSRMEQKWENPNSICVFEYTADYPLQRHTTNNYVTVSKNNYLVVRTVSTVGNYDYTIEYIFYLDGTIVTQVRASGYIFSAFLVSPPGPDQGKLNHLTAFHLHLQANDDIFPGDEGESEYGYRVHDTVSGSLHDHVINFKADLDIVGTSNTLVRVDIEPTNKAYAWDTPPSESPRHTMHLVTTPITTETGIDWPSNWASQYIILNNATHNRWGEKRGYRIAPSTGQAPHLTIVNSTSLERASIWANHHFWVLKNKESEPRSSHELNYLDPGVPLVDFEDFVDGEDITQEDLVIYFNLGAHHVPGAQDIPNTLEHISATSVMFTPHNFHDRDPSRASVQGVKISLDHKNKNRNSNTEGKQMGTGKSAVKEVKYFGAPYEEGFVVGKEMVEPDLERYAGVAHGWNAASEASPGGDTSDAGEVSDAGETSDASEVNGGSTVSGAHSGYGQAALVGGAVGGNVELTFNGTLMGMGIIPS